MVLVYMLTWLGYIDGIWLAHQTNSSTNIIDGSVMGYPFTILGHPFINQMNGIFRHGLWMEKTNTQNIGTVGIL